MGGWLKADTAATVKIGPFVDDTDFKTAETGLTIQKADVRLSKNGGDLAAAAADQGASDAGAAHDELGYYDISLGTGDTDTEGRLRVIIKESGALVVWDDFMILAAAVYDSLVAGTDKLAVDAQEISGDSTAADNLEAACDGNTYNVGGGAIVAASVTGAVGSVTGAVGSVTGAVGSVTGNVGGNVTGSVGSVAAGGITATSIATDAIDADALAADAVAEIAAGITIPAASAIADAVWDEAATGHTDAGKAGAQLWTDVDAILADTGTDGVIVAEMKQAALADFFNTDSGTDFAAAVDGSVVKETASSATVTGDVTVTSASIADIADAVWDEASTGHTDAGKAGEQLWTDIDAILDDTGTSGVVVASIADDAITAAAIATNAIDADALAADAVLEIATAALGLSPYGAGSETVTITVTSGGLPIDGVAVWITSDSAGANVIAGTVFTNALGQVVVYLDAGDYFVWKQHGGHNFDNPEAITVTDV